MSKVKEIEEGDKGVRVCGAEVGSGTHVVVMGGMGEYGVCHGLSQSVSEVCGSFVPLVPAGKWILNSSMHARAGNDGSRARVPIVVGMERGDGMGEALGCDVELEEGEDWVVAGVQYRSKVFLPLGGGGDGDGEVVELIDKALVVVGVDAEGVEGGVGWLVGVLGGEGGSGVGDPGFVRCSSVDVCR